jgi:hypothetical protein
MRHCLRNTHGATVRKIKSIHASWQQQLRAQKRRRHATIWKVADLLPGQPVVTVNEVARRLNTHPRKSLNWLCPAEVFMPDSFDFNQHYHQLVALRT